MQLRFALDLLEQRLLQERWRRQNFLVRTVSVVPGRQIVEELGQVLSDRVVGGEQSEICIKTRGSRMVVAGPDMRIAAQSIVILAHHQDDLAVGFETHHAIGYVDSIILEL